MGIPQGLQKIRDITVNRRGNFPGLERKPPIKRIGDPTNLLSDNPAIKAAAEIKQAEDLKMQKIKAIKFLAKMGCGCYDKGGKITDALLAAMDDCTPDVRIAAIEAIESAANGECCQKCGSTSCCSEKVTKRLSEIAYERDDTGCHLEPSAEVRAAAAKALCACCPNRATGPIEEDVPTLTDPEKLPTPVPLRGEGAEENAQPLKGEGTTEEEEEATNGTSESVTIDENTPQTLSEAIELTEANPFSAVIDEVASASDVEGEEVGLDTETREANTSEEATVEDNLILLRSAQAESVQEPASEASVKVGEVTMLGGMAIQPVTIAPVAAVEEEGALPQIRTEPSAESDVPVEFSIEDSVFSEKDSALSQKDSALPKPVTLAEPGSRPIALPIESARTSEPTARAIPQPSAKKQVLATIVGVNHRTGRVMLRSGQPLRPGASVTVYHDYLTGERLIAHLLIESVDGAQAVARATDRSGLLRIQSGDRAVCF